MSRTSTYVVLTAGLLIVGCQSEPAEPVVDDPAADTAVAAAISLADVAGTWDMRAVPTSGADTSATVFQSVVTADSWTLNLPGREPIQGTVTTAGDSIVVDAGPYESVRREGMTVSTHSVYRMAGGMLEGMTTARYETAEADSVLQLRVTGTRAE